MNANSRTKALFPAVFFLSLIMFALMAYRNPGVDFRGYYGAALLVRGGGNPYDYAQLVPVLEEISGFKGNNPYFYPPWYCLMFIPLTWLPFRWAQILWIGINLGLFYISLEWIWEAIDLKIESWFRWVLFTFASILFGYSSLISENSGFVLLFGLALTLRSLKRDQTMLAGLGFIIMLTKPQAMFLTIFVLGVWALREKPKAIVWAIAWLGILMVFATLIFPGWWNFNRENFGLGIVFYQDGTDVIVGKRVAATIYDWLTYAFDISGWFYVLIIVLVAALGIVLMVQTWRYRYDPTYIAAAATLLTLLITPYALLYDFVTLSLPFFIIVQCLAGLHRGWIVICVILLVLSIVIQLIAELQFQAYWVVLFVTGAYAIATQKGVSANREVLAS